MTNVEYFEMIEHEVCGCMPEDKNTKYMKSIARSLAVIADGLNPREEDEEVDEVHLQGTCKTCKYQYSDPGKEPCYSCSYGINTTKWEPK